MDKHFTKRQMINSEIARRAKNKKSHKILDRHIPEVEKDAVKIEFECECADAKCQERILLTLREYDELHKDAAARFIVAKGHVFPQIERVEEVAKGVVVVEKYALS